MQKRIEITQYSAAQEELRLETDSFDFEIKSIEDTKQMITDSDNVCFIYIVDINDEFVYISLPVQVWPSLKEALQKDQKVVLIIKDHTLELEGLKEELEYLISNIEGNANYGEEMVSRVEEIFLETEKN